MRTDIKIALFTTTKTMPITELRKIVRALQKQVTRDFRPIWGVAATLVVSTSPNPPEDHWWLGCFESSDMAGALGYHDLTSTGLPLGKAFVGTDKQYGANPSVTLSHELLEMLVDPYINQLAQVGDTTFYAYESADPVEADEDGYDIDGITVSDFVTPYYFLPQPPSPPPAVGYDFCKRLAGPMQLRPGGYQSIYEVGKGWTQVTAQTPGGGHHPTTAYRDLPRLGSRRERRYRNGPLIRSVPRA